MKYNNRKLIVIVLLIVILLLIGGTYAYWRWISDTNQRTNVVFSVGRDFSCAADGGGDITSDKVKLAPTTCMDSERTIKREVKVTPTIEKNGLTIYMDLWLDINNLDVGLASSDNFRYVLTDSDEGCDKGTIISEGNFKGYTSGSKVNLLSDKSYTRDIESETYYLYIWLDKEEKSDTTMNQEFDFSLNGSCTDDLATGPNAPVLDDGMIPVTIADNGTVTTIARNNDRWYDYEQQEWANVVLVTEESRDKYLYTSGEEVTSSDILAYYVWIPRYRYRIPNVNCSSYENVSETSNPECYDEDGVFQASNSITGPRTIDIEFETKKASKVIGDAVSTYYTHPAFWWDEYSNGNVDDGEMLSGIWIGKFADSYVDKVNKIIPGVTPISSTGETIDGHFFASLQYAGGEFNSSNGDVTFKDNAFYGFTTKTDSHLIKNSEWGAVAYLSHSKYGINKDVERVYSYVGDHYTGNSNSYEYGNEESAYPHSTTGNITGVFDMYASVMTMGNYNNIPIICDGDGWNCMGFDENFLPEAKYYDLYTNTDLSIACNGGICYGHALTELSGWYGSDFTGDRFSNSSFIERSSDTNALYRVRELSGDGRDNHIYHTTLVID